MIYGEARSLFENHYVDPPNKEAIMIAHTIENRVNAKKSEYGFIFGEVLLRSKIRKEEPESEESNLVRYYKYSCFNRWDVNFLPILNPEKDIVHHYLYKHL